MYPVSAAFLAGLRRSHRAAFRADLYDGGSLAATLDVLGGNVEVDGNAARRRRGRVGLADLTGTLTPADLTDLVAPNGNEMRLFRGLAVEGGEVEWCPLGVFGIGEVKVVDSGAGVRLEVQGMDRSRKVSRNRWEQAYALPAGTNYGTAIQDVIESRLPGTTYSFVTTTRTTPLLVLGEERENDPWKDATEMAQAIGCDLFFDPDGVCVLRPVPDETTAGVSFDYAEGVGGVLLGGERLLTDERTYNAVVVTGEGSGLDAPVREVVYDDDPASPTYVGSPPGSSDFGLVPRFLTSALITTSAQALEAGQAVLRRSLGVVEDVRFSAVVNPAHEAGDVVRVRRRAMKVDARYVLESFTVPLDVSSALTATTKKRAV